MTIHTVASLRRTRRLDRVRINVDRALRALRDGSALHLQYDRGRPHWWLCNGLEVSDEVARIIITKPDVASVDDMLFSGFLAQTWHWAGE